MLQNLLVPSLIYIISIKLTLATIIPKLLVNISLSIDDDILTNLLVAVSSILWAWNNSFTADLKQNQNLSLIV